MSADGSLHTIPASLRPSPEEVFLRHNWQHDEVEALLASPLMDLLFQAHTLHRRFFDPNAIQISSLLSIKTGGCPEDCAYCPQSAQHEEPTPASRLMAIETVLQEARKAKEAGARRFCMGAAWRSPKERDMETVCQMIEGVKALGMETCVTLGMLSATQTAQLKNAGLDYYNHNLDTSEEYYQQIITTRTYQDRLDTLELVREAGINICCGGIIGMGEDVSDRASLLLTLANLPKHPESVPINLLIKVKGTPLELNDDIDPLEFVRTIATARIMMPTSYVRMAAGRTNMTDELQAMCFFAGANSIFYGEKLLTEPNPAQNHDRALINKLGMHLQP
ncbi:biotin synthase BioB [Entomobacter blattae]|uniref:Biotin synthase n=1 Tax=Entomobacter blattae TaxID=2762277 RepID=A0A7H1NPC3_9PROT|nr:biotin synthase BioB [Entomobacter blattae]QNT77633.1 Biotin synthase [Entomobacter blattae]